MEGAPAFYTTICESLMREEGFRAHPYRCTEGALTIGYGRNLDAKGVTVQEGKLLLANDVFEAERALRFRLPSFVALPEDVQQILVELAFQMGVDGLLLFKKMLDCLNRGDRGGAADELMDSRLALQTPERARRLAGRLHGGG